MRRAEIFVFNSSSMCSPIVDWRILRIRVADAFSYIHNNCSFSMQFFLGDNNSNKHEWKRKKLTLIILACVCVCVCVLFSYKFLQRDSAIFSHPMTFRLALMSIESSRISCAKLDFLLAPAVLSMCDVLSHSLSAAKICSAPNCLWPLSANIRLNAKPNQPRICNGYYSTLVLLFIECEARRCF